jgi:hypothetical protein
MLRTHHTARLASFTAVAQAGGRQSGDECGTGSAFLAVHKIGASGGNSPAHSPR